VGFPDSKKTAAIATSPVSTITSSDGSAVVAAIFSALAWFAASAG
jgi:hypothetical protein